MSVLFFVYMTGSAIIFNPTPLIERSGNAAWLSLLLAGAIGYAILAMLLHLHRRFPGMSYVDISRALIGSVLTVMIGFATLTYLLQMQAAIVVGVGLFMINSMMRETPIYAFTFLIFLISAMTARAGIEVMARMFTLLLIITSLFTFIVLLLALPNYEPSSLFPMFPKGIKPVFHGAYYSFGFPYSEVFLCGMFLPYAAKRMRGSLPKKMYIALSCNIVLLMLTTVCSIMVFGPYAAEVPYLLFSIARVVEFQDIIQRIESVIGISLILGSYMKTTISLFFISIFVSKLFGLRESSAIVMPIALVGFLMGLATYKSATQWLFIINSIHPLWTGAVFLAPLLLLTLVAFFRKKSPSA